MAETKKTVINRGPRTFKLRAGPNGEKRDLAPGQSIECLDEKEYKQLMNYFRDIADADAIVPSNARRVAALESEIARLKSENERLSSPEEVEKELEELPEEPQESKDTDHEHASGESEEQTLPAHKSEKKPSHRRKGK